MFLIFHNQTRGYKKKSIRKIENSIKTVRELDRVKIFYWKQRRPHIQAEERQNDVEHATAFVTILDSLN